VVVHSLGAYLGGVAQVDPFQRQRDIQDQRTQREQQEKLFNLQRAMQELDMERAQHDFDYRTSPEYLERQAIDAGFLPYEDIEGIDQDRFRLTEFPGLEGFHRKEQRPGWEDPREHMARALQGQAVPLDPADVKQYEQEGLIVAEDPYAEGMFHVSFPPGYVDPASLYEGGWRQYTDDYMRRMQEAGEAIYHPHPQKEGYWLEERLGPTPEEQLQIMGQMGYQPITQEEAAFIQEQGGHVEWSGFDYEGIPFGRVTEPLGPTPEEQMRFDLDLMANYNILSPEMAEAYGYEEDQLMPLEGNLEGYYMPIMTPEMEAEMGMETFLEDPGSFGDWLISEGVPPDAALQLVAGYGDRYDMGDILQQIRHFGEEPEGIPGVDTPEGPLGGIPMPGTIGSGYQYTNYSYFDGQNFWPVVSRVEERPAPGTALGTEMVEEYYAIDPNQKEPILIPQDRVFEQTPEGGWQPVGMGEPVVDEDGDEPGFWERLWASIAGGEASPEPEGRIGQLQDARTAAEGDIPDEILEDYAGEFAEQMLEQGHSVEDLNRIRREDLKQTTGLTDREIDRLLEMVRAIMLQ